MTDAPTCPECSQAMQFGGFVLCVREDDGKRTCRALWKCNSRHVWWKWADRPDEPLEVSPMPELFR
ncbi:dehydrogenase [Streptomyces sp. NPDC057565]|uniref:dehydrogenase n=1 Tax=Streptomyces sp. NPDC057565 TaxID=3346169 RepID=UPI0036A365A6